MSSAFARRVLGSSGGGAPPGGAPRPSPGGPGGGGRRGGSSSSSSSSDSGDDDTSGRGHEVGHAYLRLLPTELRATQPSYHLGAPVARREVGVPTAEVGGPRVEVGVGGPRVEVGVGAGGPRVEVGAGGPTAEVDGARPRGNSSSSSSSDCEVDAAPVSSEAPPTITIYIRAGCDGESIGNCPFSQRLFMILWLKGVVFNVTTVDLKRKPTELRDLAPGTPPPFVTFNGELLSDVNRIEEFLESRLGPPRYPRLSPVHPECNTAGNEVFAKFSAFIKNQQGAQDGALRGALERALERLDSFLGTALGPEAPAGRPFLDGDRLTLADCNLLPKLHILKVVCKKYRSFEIPRGLRWLHSYLQGAYSREEFLNTCPADAEIEAAYHSAATGVK